jgi:hypothetical protein
LLGLVHVRPAVQPLMALQALQTRSVLPVQAVLS